MKILVRRHVKQCIVLPHIGGRMKNRIFWVAFLAIQAIALQSFGYYSVLETTDIVKSYRVTGAPQFIISSDGDAADDGTNVSGRFDFALNEELSARVLLGLGEIDVFVGGSVKWTPIPDYESQPGFAVQTGFFYADYEDEDILTLRLAPIVSKKFDTQIGALTPYASLPFGISFYDSQTDSPVNLAVGSELHVASLDAVKFIFELGLKLNDDSFSYITAGAAWDFE